MWLLLFSDASLLFFLLAASIDIWVRNDDLFLISLYELFFSFNLLCSLIFEYTF